MAYDKEYGREAQRRRRARLIAAGLTTHGTVPKFRFVPRGEVALDDETIALLRAKCEALESALGFKPTLSQCVRYILKQVEQQEVNHNGKPSN